MKLDKGQQILKVKNNNFKKKLLIILAVVLLLAATAFARLASYVNGYYEATSRALNYVTQPAEGVTVERDGLNIRFLPEHPKAGIVFYPGALVETEAYAPVMEQLAENGIECVIVGMPHYLALLNPKGAKGIVDNCPEVHDWYLSGHSLGGVMASWFAHFHSEDYKGIILMASYSVRDLTDTDLDVLLLRGSKDTVLNIETYNKNLSNLPSDYTEIIIDGGCHAFFGDYGQQKGDGKPTLTVQEQNEIVVRDILDFID